MLQEQENEFTPYNVSFKVLRRVIVGERRWILVGEEVPDEEVTQNLQWVDETTLTQEQLEYVYSQNPYQSDLDSSNVHQEQDEILAKL